MNATTIDFYVSSAYPCSYLDDRYARSLVASPSHQVTAEHYNQLIKHGFRRSGYYVYKPACDRCVECTPVRVNALEFTPNRTQRRLLKKNTHLVIQEVPAEFSSEHYELYLKYQTTRHPGGGMDTDNPNLFKEFLLQSHINTKIYEFRDQQERLIMVSVIDLLDDGLSSVYTFYDPSDNASWGTFGIVWQIEQCKNLGLPYVYLGYWIKNCSKMMYKKNFQPLEGLRNNQWVPLNPTP